jgi:hypothetical protein
MKHRFVATFRPPTYLRCMPVTRLMRFLTILAVLLAALGMVGGTPVQARTYHVASAAAHHSDVMPGMEHCAGVHKNGGKSDRQPAQKHDCMMACAAIPSFGSNIDAKPLATRAAEPDRLSTSGSGLKPEAVTPPPRFA